MRGKHAYWAAFAVFLVGATAVGLIVAEQGDDRSHTASAMGAEPSVASQPEALPAETGPGTARPSAARRFRPTYLPSEFVHRRSERENVGNAAGHVFYISYYDDGSALLQADGGVIKPPGREVIVNVTEGGSGPTDADFEAILKVDPTAKRVTVRGRPAVLRTMNSVVAVKWAEKPDVSIFLSVRGLREADLLQIAEGLVAE